MLMRKAVLLWINAPKGHVYSKWINTVWAALELAIALRNQYFGLHYLQSTFNRTDPLWDHAASTTSKFLSTVSIVKEKDRNIYEQAPSIRWKKVDCTVCATQHELRHVQCTILFRCVYLLYTSEYTIL